MDESVIARAIRLAGGVGAVAKALEMSPEGVRLWRSRARIPAERVLELERLSGVHRAMLRPDLYTHGGPRASDDMPAPAREEAA